MNAQGSYLRLPPTGISPRRLGFQLRSETPVCTSDISWLRKSKHSHYRLSILFYEYLKAFRESVNGRITLARRRQLRTWSSSSLLYHYCLQAKLLLSLGPYTGSLFETARQAQDDRAPWQNAALFRVVLLILAAIKGPTQIRPKATLTFLTFHFNFWASCSNTY